MRCEMMGAVVFNPSKRSKTKVDPFPRPFKTKTLSTKVSTPLLAYFQRL